MNDNDATSSVWSRYRDAKVKALGADPDEEADPKLSLEELEETIAQIAASSGIPETGMPPRSEVHPSQQKVLTQWFYRILLVLFAALVAGLIGWGREMYG